MAKIDWLFFYLLGQYIAAVLLNIRTRLSMQSMLQLGGSGGMPPPEFFSKLGALRLNFMHFQVVPEGKESYVRYKYSTITQLMDVLIFN